VITEWKKIIRKIRIIMMTFILIHIVWCSTTFKEYEKKIIFPSTSDDGVDREKESERE
jgi:hypothetical protein